MSEILSGVSHRGLSDQEIVQEWGSHFTRDAFKNNGKMFEVFRQHVNKPIQNISKKDIEEYIDRLAENSSSDVEYFMKSVRSFFYFALQNNLVTEDPTKTIRTRKRQNNGKPVISPSATQIVNLIERVKDRRDRLLLAILYYTGASATEVSTLTRAAVTLPGEICFADSNPPRRLALPVEFHGDLQAHVAEMTPTMPLFRSLQRNRPMVTAVISRLVREIGADHGIENLTPIIIRSARLKQEAVVAPLTLVPSSRPKVMASTPLPRAGASILLARFEKLCRTERLDQSATALATMLGGIEDLDALRTGLRMASAPSIKMPPEIAQQLAVAFVTLIRKVRATQASQSVDTEDRVSAA